MAHDTDMDDGSDKTDPRNAPTRARPAPASRDANGGPTLRRSASRDDTLGIATGMHAISVRLRALLGLDRGTPIELAAERLHVSEVALRMSVDRWSPNAAQDVLIATIREYGVDPSWLLTGVYSAATHHEALDAERPISVLRSILRRLAHDVTHD